MLEKESGIIFNQFLSSKKKSLYPHFQDNEGIFTAIHFANGR